MNILKANKIKPITFQLALGPLEYQLVAHDEWGKKILTCLSASIDRPPLTEVLPDRVIHVCSLPQGSDNCKEERKLPKHLEIFLPVKDQGRKWSYRRNLVNTVWSSTETNQCFWTAGINSNLGQFRYHLPWDLLLQDMKHHNGGLIHGGLAEHQGAALLILAPPGGGKSTILATAPETWQVLSDDAALIWPLGTIAWQATPIPSWGMLNKTTTGPTSSLKQLNNRIPIHTILRLYQNENLNIKHLQPVKAIPQIYRALREYPAAFLADPVHRPHFFRTAAALARQVPCWRLDMPIYAPVWARIESLMEETAK